MLRHHKGLDFFGLVSEWLFQNTVLLLKIVPVCNTTSPWHCLNEYLVGHGGVLLRNNLSPNKLHDDTARCAVLSETTVRYSLFQQAFLPPLQVQESPYQLVLLADKPLIQCHRKLINANAIVPLEYPSKANNDEMFVQAKYQ